MRVGFIYKLYCLDDAIKSCYIGSCWKIKKRMNNHKSNCSNINSAEYNKTIYKCIRVNGGWCNWDYEYYQVEVIDTTDLKMKEQKRMDIEINILLNDRRAYTYDKERLKKKYNCPCGGKYKHQAKSIHFKTLRHRCFEIMVQV